MVSEIFDMKLHPGPVSREQVQRHAPFLPDHDGLVAVCGQDGLDVLLVRLVRVLDAHQQPLRGGRTRSRTSGDEDARLADERAFALARRAGSTSRHVRARRSTREL